MRNVHIGKFIDNYKFPDEDYFEANKISRNTITKSYNLQFYVDDERGMVILKNATPIEKIVARMKYIINKKKNIVIGFTNNYIIEEKEKIDYQNKYEDYIKKIKYEV